ncbi:MULTISPECIES: SHOCT domain-containing protein [unclassified Aureimonas]|uniref:SHOCT domain-containing protein n=1 Tax=unclassified Aureimonas TaxID=2615206 RepID=UPI0006FB62AB|nr:MULTISPECIES: SHOCT domain-containing protein [unclassified Aureimonas]KQT53023.1 hypothetical protein ASG62_14065 [Aureimonas sp. Leaf427]KQT80479.1 hypothetical protein ASG54_07915 [Aureimonas sp. Leaf460]
MTSSPSGDGDRAIADIAERHGFKPEAAKVLAEALKRSGGSMAQFNHPDLGGMGQWSKGGMMMIGDMNNGDLKARVGDLARDLSDAVQSGKIGDEAQESSLSKPSSSSHSSSSSSSSSSGGSWWPGDLGTPSSTGSQNNSRYAVFPDKQRLAIDDGGHVTVYDTGDERIEGASQQQGGDSSMRFSTRSGSVRVEDLKKVGDGDSQDDVRAKRQAGPASPVGSSPTPGRNELTSVPSHSRDRSQGSGDPIDLLRRLAALRDEGILTEAEFSAKKTEILARL